MNMKSACFYEEQEDRQTRLAQAQKNLLILNKEIDQLQKDIAESSLNEEERLKLLQDVQVNRQQADQGLLSCKSRKSNCGVM